MKEDGFPHSVTVYGTGLMGSSFALALKKHNPDVRVFGIDGPDILGRARRLGIIDPDPPSKSDLLILAAPVGQILKLLDEIEAGPQTLIIDVGSTKVEVCKKAERRSLPFVGGHPMTGSERSGPESASAA